VFTCSVKRNMGWSLLFIVLKVWIHLEDAVAIWKKGSPHKSRSKYKTFKEVHLSHLPYLLENCLYNLIYYVEEGLGLHPTTEVHVL
jgi:hypothetical protein